MTVFEIVLRSLLGAGSSKFETKSPNPNPNPNPNLFFSVFSCVFSGGGGVSRGHGGAPANALGSQNASKKKKHGMETRHVECPGNRALAAFLVQKREEFLQKSYKENLDSVFLVAHKSVCESRLPLHSLKEASKVKGIGKWLLKILGEFYKDAHVVDDQQGDSPKAMKSKAPRRYVPKKNSAPYAVLITLYRAVQAGKEYMMKQELIDAAEASGLSHMPIEPNKGVVPPRFGAGPQYSYAGWSSMKTLIDKSLVVKKNCPAKYMLTDEGKRTAEECLERSGMGSGENASQISPLKEVHMGRNEGQSQGNVRDEGTHGSCRRQISQDDQPSLSSAPGHTTMLDIAKLQEMGFGQAEIHAATQKAAKVGVTESDLWGFVLGALVGGKGDGNLTQKDNLSACPSNVQGRGALGTVNGSWYHSAPSVPMELVIPSSYAESPSKKDQTGPKACTSSTGERIPASTSRAVNELAVPPLAVGESFGQAYDVILILDSREQFRHDAKGSASLYKFAERMRIQFQIEVETRQLPVGDALWFAKHKCQEQEYVLDFIVERKRVDDLWSSIRDTRYKQQKLRIMRCGLRKLLYLVEGDPNLMDSAESLKTAMFTTEILEGFDVQHTRDANETFQKYGELTHAITNRYLLESGKPNTPPNAVCPTFVEFLERCKDLDMERVSDVFGVQLMQVRNVTEDMALSILERYPTVLSLAKAYSNLEGDLTAQEKLLTGIPIRNKSKTISEKISRNIFKLIWAQ